MWTEGIFNLGDETVYYQVKHYDEPSKYGIYGGRISKLYLKQNGKCVGQYDREWVLEPTTWAAKMAFEDVLSRYN